MLSVRSVFRISTLAAIVHSSAAAARNRIVVEEESTLERIQVDGVYEPERNLSKGKGMGTFADSLSWSFSTCTRTSEVPYELNQQNNSSFFFAGKGKGSSDDCVPFHPDIFYDGKGKGGKGKGRLLAAKGKVMTMKPKKKDKIYKKRQKKKYVKKRRSTPNPVSWWKAAALYCTSKAIWCFDSIFLGRYVTDVLLHRRSYCLTNLGVLWRTWMHRGLRL